MRHDSVAVTAHGRHHLPVPAEVLAGIEMARRFSFQPDAQVAGCLIQADIGPVSWGAVYGCDAHQAGTFVKFDACGLDRRNEWDIVRVAGGGAFVIVGFAEHTRIRGVCLLREHMAVNREHYEDLLRVWRRSGQVQAQPLNSAA